MKHCKWCNKSGLFYSITENGLCYKCEFTIIKDTEYKLGIINETRNRIEESKNIGSVLTRTEIVLHHLKDLIKYDDKGIQILALPAKILIKNVAEISNEKLIEVLKTKYQIAKEKADNRLYNKLISEAGSLKNHLFDDGENYKECLKTIDTLIAELKERTALP